MAEPAPDIDLFRAGPVRYLGYSNEAITARRPPNGLRFYFNNRVKKEFYKLHRMTLGTGLARTGTNTGTPREPPKRLARQKKANS